MARGPTPSVRRTEEVERSLDERQCRKGHGHTLRRCGEQDSLRLSLSMERRLETVPGQQIAKAVAWLNAELHAGAARGRIGGSRAHEPMTFDSISAPSRV